MKKVILLITLFSYLGLFAQCKISGPDQLQVGERQIYTAEKADPSCENCFEWSHLDQQIILETATNANPLTVKGTVTGDAVLSLKISLPDEILTCKKVIKVIEPTSTIMDNSHKCIIEVDSIIEKVISENQVIFEASISADNMPLKWTLFYRNGTQKVSDQHKPTFEFSTGNPIDKVELMVGTKKCNKSIVKSYHKFFWFFLE